MRIRLEGTDLPGRSFCLGTDVGRDDVRIGVQRKAEVVDEVAGDSSSVTWTFEVDVRPGKDGERDFFGPFVHGKRGDRFLYLSWSGVGKDGERAMFRRAKLHFADVDEGVLRRAVEGGELVGTVVLTDGCGEPLCARVRPPAIRWSTGS